MPTLTPIVTLMGFSFNIYGVVLLVLFLIFALAMHRAGKNGRLDWRDMITRDGSKVSTTKILQLVGGVVGTWIIIQVTLQEKLTWDLFAIYLAYVASIDGFSKFVTAKYRERDSRSGYSGYVGSYGYEEDETPKARRKTTAKAQVTDEPDQQLRGAAKTPDIDP